jgi:hypothetical protein
MKYSLLFIIALVTASCKQDNTKYQINEFYKKYYQIHSSSVPFIYKTNGSKISKDLLDSFPKLNNIGKSIVEYLDKPILRISDIQCNVCYENELNLLAEEGKSDFIIFASFNNVRNLKIALGDYFNNVPVFIVEDSKFLPMDELGVPYYFEINQAFEINHVFVPIKGLDEITRNYIKVLE